MKATFPEAKLCKVVLLVELCIRSLPRTIKSRVCYLSRVIAGPVPESKSIQRVAPLFNKKDQSHIAKTSPHQHSHFEVFSPIMYLNFSFSEKAKENVHHLSHGFDLVNVKTIRKMAQIFVGPSQKS